MSSKKWDEAIRRVIVRMEDTATQLAGRFPHWAETATGEWVSTEDGDWTGGYYIGMHWLSLRAEESEMRATRAKEMVSKLRSRIGLDSVFKSYPFYYACSVGALLGHRGEHVEMALRCADSLIGMYRGNLRLIPLGSQAEEGSHVGNLETSIDSMQTAPFLFWAAAEKGDSRMREVAINHADRIGELHFRTDGSFIQSTSLDAKTGELVRHFTHKGYSDRSTWGRAQAWGMLYTTMCYLREPTRQKWLDWAIRGADWWLSNVPKDHISYWDFDDPAIPNTERDSAATAIAAAALLRLATVAPAEKALRYREFAEATVGTLIERCLTPIDREDRRPTGILTNACFNKRADARPMDASGNCEFIVGDYYFFESLLGLGGYVDVTKL